MKKLLNKIAAFFGFVPIRDYQYLEEVSKNILYPKLTIKQQTSEFFTKLEDKKFKATGKFKTANSQYFTFGNQQDSILIQVHKQGDIAKVYRHINENNIDILLAKILDKNLSLKQATEEIEVTITYLIDKDIINNPPNIETISKRLKKAIVKLRDLQ